MVDLSFDFTEDLSLGSNKTDFTKTEIIWEVTRQIPSQISNPLVDLSFDFTGRRYQGMERAENQVVIDKY